MHAGYLRIAASMYAFAVANTHPLYFVSFYFVRCVLIPVDVVDHPPPLMPPTVL
jgi:hypothetical protein